MDDRTLASAAAQGDETAFEALVERYRRYIYTIAWKITLHEDDALDVTQDVLALLAERIGQWRGEGPLRAWLAAIAARAALDFLRRQRRHPEEVLDPAALELAMNGGAGADAGGRNRAGNREAGHGLGWSSLASVNPRAEAERNERREMVGAAMGALSPQQRTIFWLRWKEELGPGEIADRLGLAPGQVRVQLHRAIERLRETIDENTNNR